MRQGDRNVNAFRLHGAELPANRTWMDPPARLDVTPSRGPPTSSASVIALTQAGDCNNGEAGKHAAAPGNR
jgi:hypothetical protein